MKHLYLFFAVLMICMFLFGTLPRLSRPAFFTGAQDQNRLVVESPTSSITFDSAANDMTSTNSSEPAIPQAGAISASLMVSSAPPAVSFPELSDFAAEMISIAQSDELIGVYVPGLFALPVQQQPAGRPEYVANENDLLTQFSLPSRYGSTALLAHNYLSGSMFAMFDYDQEVALIFGDGRIEYYRIERIQRFQALAPNSPFSQFVSLESPDGGEVLSSADLFNSIYTNAGELVFQTCIDAEGDPSWGRLFITATPIDPLQGSLPQVGQFLSNN